ncbi:MAG: hypothetical protein ACT4P7_23440 [Gemmatimonadaceae bacterium]
MIRRRMAAVVSALLFAQLLLVGASPLCRGGGLEASSTDAQHGASHGPASGRPSPERDVPEQESVPECAATSMCAVVMVATAATEIDVGEGLPETRVPNRSRRWTSVVRTPALPPPRA